MDVNFKQLIMEQTALLATLEKSLRNIKKDSASRKTEVYLKTRLESAARLHVEFRENHRVLMRAGDVEEVQRGYITTEIGDKFEEMYIDVVSLLRSDLPEPTPIAQTAPREQNGDNLLLERFREELKLPLVKLPVFSGKFSDWPAFKEIFEERVHKCTRYSNLHRFHYLKDSLSEDAARDIQHLTLTEPNYLVAWNMLINIYDNKRILFLHFMDLFEQQPPVAHNDPAALKRFVQTCRSCINSIDRLGIDLKGSQILVYLMTRKISDAARLEWEKSLAITQNMPTFEQFCSYLDSQYRIMITASTSISSTAKKSTTVSGESSLKAKKAIKSSFATSTKQLCLICSQVNHSIRACAKFLNMSVSERKAAIEEHKLCFNCLGHNHVVSKCPSRRLCNHCGGHHHTLIHVDRPTAASNVNSKQTSSDISSATTTQTTQIEPVNKATATSYTSNCDVLLPTAIVGIQTKNGSTLDFRAFLDQGSQASFISERAAQMLTLNRRKVHVHIKGLTNMKITETSACVTLVLKSKYDAPKSFKVHAYVISNVGCKMPERRLDISQWKHLSGLPLADPTYHVPQVVDLLLGSDIYDELMLDELRRGEPGTPIAQNTTLGYIVSGKIGAGGNSKLTHNVKVTPNETSEELELLLRKYWEIEDINNSEHIQSDHENWCEEFYKSSHRRLSTGKYVVKLPLLSQIDPNLSIGSSYEPALKRLNQLQRRLSRDSELKSVYNDTIRDYVNLGQMKKVVTLTPTIPAESVLAVPHCYLPHHPVIKESSSTTKVRVVFDGSMRTSNGKSLNDILAVGPKLHQDLAAILIKWRMSRKCIDASTFSRRMQIFNAFYGMMNTEANWSIICVRQSCSEPVQHRSPSLAVEVINQQMYVDDILSGANSIEQSKEIRNQVIGMLKTGTFELRKWASNIPELLDDIPVDHREKRNVSPLNADDVIKALGLYWNPVEDAFRFRIDFALPAGDPSKRKVLSTIARLFDPMGWLSPVLIAAKIFMQRLWQTQLGWDQRLPTNLEHTWTKFITELPSITKLKIPRFIIYDDSNQPQLHIFCDASSSAYGAAAYVRSQLGDHRYEVRLLLARCKVLPIKPQLTIPRAELCAAMLAAKLFRYLEKHCYSHMSFQKTVFWTDSTIVLSWIRGGPSKWKVFVSNRVDQILQRSQAHQWHYVTSENNPADYPSRGVKPSNLSSCKMWWHGPQFLSEGEDSWPKFNENNDGLSKTINDEVKALRSHAIATSKTPQPNIAERFSSYTRMLRVLSFCKRFIRNCRLTSMQRNYSSLSVAELHESLLTVIRIVQLEHFTTEVKALSTGKTLQKGSTISSLNPFFDEPEKVIRLGGRLRHALLSPKERNPYIIPSKGHFTDLLVRHSHITTLHGGVSLTLAHIRKSCWIVNARSAVRRVIFRCMTCYRLQPKSFEQKMGDLPPARVRPSRPFCSVGVDYAGPINISPSKGRGRTALKGYVALFICLATKAIHLEPVGDLTSDSFLGAFQRFVGRRGLCKDIYSDCGTNFVGANKKLQCDKQAYRKYIETKILPFLLQHDINWHFIPPSAPHFGGLWEAGVKSMKFHLKRAMGDRVLTFEEVATILAQIESCLNSRPLCPLSNDPDDLFVLTSGHFLTGDSLLAPPVPEIPKISLVDRWRNCQYITQQFWRNWSGEYLSRLQRRPKWLSPSTNVKINDIVIIQDDRFPPNQWPLGRIIEVHPGVDGFVRVATLKTKNGILMKRPIAKLCPLPTQDPTDYDSACKPEPIPSTK